MMDSGTRPEEATARPRPSWLKPFRMITVGEGVGAEEIVRCAMCSSRDVITEYHPTVVLGCQCEVAVRDLSMGDATPEEIDSAYRTEHLCRNCLSCQYSWCEETADAAA